MERKVSLIIPAYKAEDTLERAVTSLVTGDHPNIEVIIVDDGSPDGTGAVGEALQTRYPEQVVYLRNEKNAGVSATRNRGLDNAHGAYLMFLDSDDWAEPDFVRCLVEAIRPGVMPVCGYVNHDEVKNGRTDVFGWSGEPSPRSVSLCEGLQELYDNRLLQMIWNKVFAADVVREHRLRFDTALHCGEDFRFLLEYLTCAGIREFLFLNGVPYHYSRDNAHSLATRYTEVALEEPLYNLGKMYALMGKNEEETAVLLEKERQAQLHHYAYGYIHDESLSRREKKQKILALPLENAKQVYRDLRWLSIKEKMRRMLR